MCQDEKWILKIYQIKSEWKRKKKITISDSQPKPLKILLEIFLELRKCQNIDKFSFTNEKKKKLYLLPHIYK